MVASFSFPPPPPPPTKAVPEPHQNPAHGVADRGGRGRGRGRGRGGRGARGDGGRGRGVSRQDRWPDRSEYHGQHKDQTERSIHQSYTGYQRIQSSHERQKLPPGSYVNPNFGDSLGELGHFQQMPAANPLASIGPPRTLAGHKRKLDALRLSPANKSQPKLPTAPSVPSFGAPILPSKPVAALSPGTDVKAKAGGNGLGLTPTDEERRYSSDEDDGDGKDVDEEAMFTELGSKLAFEHNGVVTSLSSAADLAAWKEERKKNWPTRTRMNEKEVQRRKTGEERNRLLAGVLALQAVSASAVVRSRRNVDGPDESQQVGSGKDGSKTSETKLEKARKELAQQSKKLEVLRQRVSDSQATLQKAQAEKEERDQEARVGHAVAPDGPTSENDSDYDGSDISSILSESSVVSSDSCASEASDDDGPPEEATARALSTSVMHSERPICKFYYASGHCRDGHQCRFRHELGPGVQKASESQKPARGDPHAPKLDRVDRERKNIFQRLMEQQEEEEGVLAVKVIKYLGKAGFFKIDMDAEPTSMTAT
ncbi:Nuclear fragile X mental retardation-interacting protein 1 (NUFIP1) [Teratosphaeria destructans]|uniref:Nuclear fragile X mental retardation-interacting protein 1 (NUFIP1) n=1 Tax=Teratosphaeria destructans TaxID=418781 RepID=A0A9W7W0I5_9PEZI|nr:Nuclear fragile X mental retardation-interacting protein 1 (NUFIP1) [Teratosphaeria destructans]